MSFVEVLEPMNHRVKTLLIKYPELRDNDQKLVVTIWEEELERELERDIDRISGRTVLDIVSEEKLSKVESITRARRFVQAEYPELQGTLRDQRKWEEENTSREINKLEV